jgi:hypothetical protein
MPRTSGHDASGHPAHLGIDAMGHPIGFIDASGCAWESRLEHDLARCSGRYLDAYDAHAFTRTRIGGLLTRLVLVARYSWRQPRAGVAECHDTVAFTLRLRRLWSGHLDQAT